MEVKKGFNVPKLGSRVRDRVFISPVPLGWGGVSTDPNSVSVGEIFTIE